MLTSVEKAAFLFLTILAIGATFAGLGEMYRIVMRGQNDLYLDRLPQRLWNALVIYITQKTTLKTRRFTSLLHWGVVLGFTYYFLVNAVDVLRGYIANFDPYDWGIVGGVFRLFGDLFSMIVLIGVAYLLLRRFVLPSRRELGFHANILLHPKVLAGGIRRDSLIVGVFILIHVGARFLGESVRVAEHGADLWQPFATLVSTIWSGASPDGLLLLDHLFWWIALGAIVLFTPYFAYSKHAHLFMAPLNYLTRPRRTSLGEMEKLDFEDESKEQFGAHKLEDLTKTNLVDAFACIMCNRCQDVCPAYVTGKELSPSAYEINKRYLIKDEMTALADGQPSTFPLMASVGAPLGALSESAVWACTACGACIDICPVGNEPMLDILDIRRDAVLVQGEFPKELGSAFKGMERQGNPWGNPENRFRWAKDMDVPTVEDNPDFDVLYWVGCAASYDPRAQLTARSLVKVLEKAGVNYAVLGEMENCTGDSARRAGNEDLYQGLATQNVETLNEVFTGKARRIVVTCPHCFHNIGKEYHQFGGEYEVVHHTELLDELMAAGKIPKAANPKQQPNVTFHDPCYLGRHNDVVDAPRHVLDGLGVSAVEMPRHGKKSFCCGAGGAQFWKEEEHGVKAVSAERYDEAKATGADTLAVGCPFCMQMFTSAQTGDATPMQIKDVVELVAERMGV